MTQVTLNALRPDVCSDASFAFKVFGPISTVDLPGRNGKCWSKATFAAVGEFQQTATVLVKFFGDGQDKRRKEWIQKFTEGSAWTVNPSRLKGCGFKGNPKNVKYSNATCPCDLEMTEKTVLQKVDVNLPARPFVSALGATLEEKHGGDQRANIAGVVVEAADRGTKDIKHKLARQKCCVLSASRIMKVFGLR